MRRTKRQQAISDAMRTQGRRRFLPADVADGAPGDDRDRAGGYLHRDIRPQARRAIPPQPRPVVVSFRDADFAAPPRYR